jgi:hypothetical protein
MDTTLALFVYKLVCIGSGLLVCYFGFRLFVLGIFTGGGDLTSQFQNTKLVLKKGAPGTFFALFGAVILSVTLWKGLQIEGRSAMPATAETNGRAAEIRAQGFGESNDAPAGDHLEARRAEVRGTLYELNTLRSRLAADVPKDKLTDLQIALRDSKLALIGSVWSKEWGDYRQFRQWLIDGETQPAPASFQRAPVELFHHGDKE